MTEKSLNAPHNGVFRNENTPDGGTLKRRRREAGGIPAPVIIPAFG